MRLEDLPAPVTDVRPRLETGRAAPASDQGVTVNATGSDTASFVGV